MMVHPMAAQKELRSVERWAAQRAYQKAAQREWKWVDQWVYASAAKKAADWVY